MSEGHLLTDQVALMLLVYDSEALSEDGLDHPWMTQLNSIGKMLPYTHMFSSSEEDRGP